MNSDYEFRIPAMRGKGCIIVSIVCLGAMGQKGEG